MISDVVTFKRAKVKYQWPTNGKSLMDQPKAENKSDLPG